MPDELAAEKGAGSDAVSTLSNYLAIRELVEYHDVGMYCPPSDPRAGNPDWPWRPPSGHSPTWDFPSPSAPATARFPPPLGDDLGFYDTLSRRTCGR